MGNCITTTKKKKSSPETVSTITPTPAVVNLYAAASAASTAYLRYAISLKPTVSLLYVPSTTPNFGSTTPVIQHADDVVSGSTLTILRYLDSKFPKPPLLGYGFDETTPLVVVWVAMQHRSVRWHLERMVRWGEDLAGRGGKARGDPVMGSPRMEVKKYGNSYGMLLEVMLEHAQMEERVVFPILEKADRGVSKAANEEHARDLPIMNGIREDIKSIVVLNSQNSYLQEALYDLSARIKTLQDHYKEHFETEERELLPLMEAAELSKEQQERILEQCLDMMPSTHSRLFSFFMEGLVPQEAILYLDLIQRCCTNKDRVSSVFNFLVD